MKQILVNEELLRQALDWFQCHKDNSMSRNNSEQLADELSVAIRTELEQPAVEPVAWMTFDGEGGYDLRLYEMNESYRDDFIRRNGERYADWVTPLYAAPQAQEKS